MATKNYGLTGVGSSLQFGKGGVSIAQNGLKDEFTLLAGDGVTTANVVVGTPTSDAHAATKAYVDEMVQGLLIKEAVAAATAGSGDTAGFTYTAGTDTWTSVTAPTIDGVVLADADRVLIKNAADARGNGIWTYNATANTFERADDANNQPSNEVRGGMFTFVSGGTVNASSGWVMTSPSGAAVLGTDNLVFTQFSTSGTITVGAGSALDKVGNALSVRPDGTTIGINAVGNGQLQVSSSGVAGQLLISTGVSGQAAVWSALDISTDTTPQLGGNLDVNGNSIISSGNGDINIAPNGTGHVIVSGLTLPNADGTNGQVLTTNGSGVISFQDVPSGELVDDTTPQLGGNLDVNGYSIVSVGGTALNINSQDDGALSLTGGDISVVSSTGVITIGSLTDSVSIAGFMLPVADGTAGQVLATDGNGELSFVNPAVGGITAVVDDTTPQLGGDLDVNDFAITAEAGHTLRLHGNGTADIQLMDNALSIEGETITIESSAVLKLNNLFFPLTSGSAGQVLAVTGVSSGNGSLGFVNLPAAGIGAVVDDTSPQLGGDLDVNGNSIVSVSNGNITLAPNGTGVVEISSDLDMSGNSIIDVENISSSGILTLSSGSYTEIDGLARLQNVQLVGVIQTLATSNADIVFNPDGTGVLSVAGTVDYESNISDDDDIPNKKYVDDAIAGAVSGISTETAKRAVITADSVETVFNIGSVLPSVSGKDVYVTRISLGVTTAFVGATEAVIKSGVNTIAVGDDSDVNEVGTYIIDVVATSASTAEQLTIEFDTAPTAGSLVAVVEFIVV